MLSLDRKPSGGDSMARRWNWFWVGVAAILAAFLLWLRPQDPPKILQADSPLELPQAQPKLLALTFDDGPRRSTTSRLLDGLDQRGVQATFFLIGKQLEGNEDLVRRMADSGHQIGVHTFDHVELHDLSPADIDRQLTPTRDALRAIVGDRDFALRPPYGFVDDGVVSQAGAPIILWSVDPEDWHDRNVQREVAHVVTHVQDGDIILMHDIFDQSVDAALQVIDQLHQAGYAFVTVDDLLLSRGILPENGEIYRHAHPD